MSSFSEYDTMGELFRRRLENHRMPVDGNGWDDIKRRMGKRKNKTVIWLWRIGAVAAAASVAVLMIFNRPETIFNDSDIQTSNDLYSDNFGFQTKMSEVSKTSDISNDSDIQSANDSVTRLFSYSVTHEKLDVSLVEDRPEEDETTTKKTDKWLLAATFGLSGRAGDNDRDENSRANSQPKMGLSGSNNAYAADMSSNIQSFEYLSRNNFTSINHLAPFSLGLTARKSLGKHGGFESGITYTYLSSWFNWWSNRAHQSLHYMGIPVNMVVYLWNTNPNWQIYLSGGFTVEKGLRAIYRQETRWGPEIRTTTVKSSINGWQWSLNGALGINYRLEKGWGIYFEPRTGYSFDCNQPVSIRTEWPVYFGIHLGLNYEL